MKVYKQDHYRNCEEEQPPFILKEGTALECLATFKRWATYTLPIFEGLKPIAGEATPTKAWITFAEGLSKDAYYVRLTIEA